MATRANSGLRGPGTPTFLFNRPTGSFHNSNVGEVVSIKAAGREAEVELVEACRRGDPAALEQVFVAHAPYLERLLSRLTGPDVELEDILQRTFMAAIRAFPRFRGEASVRTWLVRIAIRTVHEQLRRPERRRRVDVAALELLEPVEGDRADRSVDAKQQVARLYAHLDAIKPKKRLAFMLHVFEGHSIDEVAALTGASRAATKSRVFWARRELFRRAGKDPILKELVEEAQP